MSKPGDDRPAEPGGSRAGPGASRPKEQPSPAHRSTESVPRPDQTRSLDFTALREPAADAARGSQDRARVEQAATLYAGGQATQAKACLLDGLEASSERVWLMLLELHQELGERAEFEARARAFKARFGRAAPGWRALDEQVEAAMLRTGGAAYVGLSGRLSAQSAPQLDKLRAVARQYPMLRIDFAKLQGADGPGCRLLLDLLQAIRHGGGAAGLTGEGVLLEALARATHPGERQVDAALWLLRLEMLQLQGRRADFEAVAQQYAATYGSPAPVFEAAQKAPTGVGEDGVLQAPAEIADNAQPFLRAIAQAAESRAHVVVDCGRLRRIDVAAARALHQLAASFEAHGRRLELRQANALVVALLESTGVSALSTVVPRE